VFELCGIHFGEEEVFLLQKSLAKLSIKVDKPITLFGKILGSKRDYYVATTNVYGGEDEGGEGADADMEAKGTGVNKQTFWVANDVFSDWTELP